MKNLLLHLMNLINMDIDMRDGTLEEGDIAVPVRMGENLLDDQEVVVVMSDHRVYAISVRRIV